jgi:hypothetical protein
MCFISVESYLLGYNAVESVHYIPQGTTFNSHRCENLKISFTSVRSKKKKNSPLHFSDTIPYHVQRVGLTVWAVTLGHRRTSNCDFRLSFSYFINKKFWEVLIAYCSLIQEPHRKRKN